MKKFKENLKNFKNNSIKKFKAKKGVEASTFTVITAVVVAAIVLVNILVANIASNKSFNIDLTSQGFYTLSDETKNYIQNIDKDISINVMNTKSTFCSGESSVSNSNIYYTQASNIIDQFAKCSDKITVNYIDPNSDPNFTSQFKDRKFYGNEVVVMGNGTYKIIDAYELFNFNNSASSYASNSYGIESSKAEQVITSAILNITSTSKVKATFLTGYSEEDNSALKTLLEDNNYDVTDANVISEEIPQDTRLLVLFAPNKDYDKMAIDKINNFLNNNSGEGVGVIYIASVNNQSFKNINNFLSNYGMNIGNGVAYSTDKKTQMASSNGYIPFYCTTTYADEDYTKGLTDTNTPVLSAQAHPINISDANKAKTLLKIATGGVSTNDKFSDYNENADNKDICVAAISKNAVADKTDKYNYVATIGSNLDFDQSVLAYNSVNNSNYFINLFNIITSNDTGVTISPKSTMNANLGITAFQAYIIAAVLVVIVPIIILIYGIAIWAIRRHR